MHGQVVASNLFDASISDWDHGAHMICFSGPTSKWTYNFEHSAVTKLVTSMKFTQLRSTILKAISQSSTGMESAFVGVSNPSSAGFATDVRAFR